MCKETIYRQIYADAKIGGTLWKSLPPPSVSGSGVAPAKMGAGAEESKTNE